VASAEAVGLLHRAGWSVEVASIVTPDGSGRVVRRVDGRNGENLIRAEGATQGEARRAAVAQAHVLGMLGRQLSPPAAGRGGETRGP
jgi:hypothetical protein